MKPRPHFRVFLKTDDIIHLGEEFEKLNMVLSYPTLACK
jgi:hypothetical protein